MKYDEINQISDIQEKENRLREFYINEIGVEDWLQEKIKNQKIRFKDRVEYKENGEYHRLDGPAIDFNDKEGLYFINGEAMQKSEWEPIAKKLLRKFKIKRVLNDD